MGLRNTLAYVLDELEENYTDTFWWRGRITARLNSPFHRLVYPRYTDGVHVMEEDWDNLFVFDACRADLFEDVCDVGRFDAYRRVRSLGSTTEEWTLNNFTVGTFGDTVYVTANPYTTKVASDRFHELVNVWEESFDERGRTVRPRPLIRAAKSCLREYPDKRLIVHFMQPHYPFVGSEEFVGAGMSPQGVMDGSIGEKRKMTAWRALEQGRVSKGTVWKGYRDNLTYVLDEVEGLDRELGGKTVFTSDHGNVLGVRSYPVPIRIYGHPGGLRHDGLVTVPWAERIVGERRTIVDDGVTLSNRDRAEIDERLRDLGYAE